MTARGPSRDGVFIRQVAAAPWTGSAAFATCRGQPGRKAGLADRGPGVVRSRRSTGRRRSSNIREIQLRSVAGPDLLRRQAQDPTLPRHERDLALQTLLCKEVTHGKYADFVKDVALVSSSTSSGIALLAQARTVG
ncbi:MAG: hypothetical protein FJ148_09910 [Deltaproteobacteria bacterium]|nr:hypothetical protein [Deltaproteobacteria bacterium]